MADILIGGNLDLQLVNKIVNSGTPVNSKDLTNKEFVEGLLAVAIAQLEQDIATLANSTLKTPVEIDCSSNPLYPAAEAGESFIVTVPGTIGGDQGNLIGVAVNNGDTIFCKTDSPDEGTHAAVGSNFFIVENNRDKATETVGGYIQLATLAEVVAGSNQDKAITPYSLQQKLSSLAPSSFAIGDGTATQFVINHGRNSLNVQVQVRQSTETRAFVWAGIEVIDANNIRVTYNPAPLSGELTVIVE